MNSGTKALTLHRSIEQASERQRHEENRCCLHRSSGVVWRTKTRLIERLESGKKYDTPLDVPMITHWLHNMSHDNVLGMLKYLDMQNRNEDKVKLIFLPCYLDGNDGILNIPYYDIILGNDLCIYPSYYEPWGYTPLESIAFKVPCITTDLAGFGLGLMQKKADTARLKMV